MGIGIYKGKASMDHVPNYKILALLKGYFTIYCTKNPANMYGSAILDYLDDAKCGKTFFFLRAIHIMEMKSCHYVIVRAA